LSYSPVGCLSDRPLFDFLVHRMLAAEGAILLDLQPLGLLLLVPGVRVVPALARRTAHGNDVSHIRLSCGPRRARTPRFRVYSRMSVTVPAPTVRPPSRIANRSPFSIATSVISEISRFTLSPGITISTPSGSFAFPVTSVVRK